MIKINVQTEDFNVSEEYELLRKDNSDDGAIVFFCGQVRDINLGKTVSGLFLEHYPGMTEKSLHSIAEQAKERWPLNKVRIIHRVGQLNPSDQIVLVAATSAHRGAAFEATEFMMDYLKTRAPFWKKETSPDGEKWIEAKESDEQQLQRWSKPN